MQIPPSGQILMLLHVIRLGPQTKEIVLVSHVLGHMADTCHVNLYSRQTNAYISHILAEKVKSSYIH